MGKKTLTEKQKRFCQAYLIDPNATKAAIKAGYKKRTAESQGSRLLTNVKVKEFLGIKQEKIAEKAELTAAKVLQDLEQVRAQCMEPEEIFISGKGSGQYKFNSQGALKALELQGKHLKMFTEKHEHSGPGGGPIATNITVNFVKSKITKAQQ